MNYKEYVNKNKEIQNKLLLFFDKEDEIEENYNNLIELFTKYKIIDNLHELKSFLYLISNISNNHYRTPKFKCKIEQLFESLKESLKNNFANQQIFSIFKNNKAILLILIEQEIITFDETILIEISSYEYFKKSYHQFFFPEIQPLIAKNKETNSKEENESKDGESNSSENSSEDNDDDNYDDEYEYEYDTGIDSYFYQSPDFKNFYRKFSKKLPENFIKERQIGQNENEICKLIREDSIDGFITYVNNDITNYILSNFIKENIENIDQINFERKYNENIYSYSFHYYNFSYFPSEIEHQIIFYYACEYDYIDIVEYFLKTKKIDIKEKIIYNFKFIKFKIKSFL